jgi:hypothetical protein
MKHPPNLPSSTVVWTLDEALALVPGRIYRAMPNNWKVGRSSCVLTSRELISYLCAL